MIARLWWKEARRVWPIWAFLVALGLSWMSALRWYFNVGPGPRVALIGQAFLITLVYVFLIGAAVFAGERENRTLELLDALPVERWRVWVAKATFAAASTGALGLLLSLFAMALDGPPPAAGRAMVAFVLLCGFGWSLFWSALLGNALLAAALGIGSLTLTVVGMASGPPLAIGGLGDEPPPAGDWLFPPALVAASAAVLLLGGPPRRSWFGARRRPRGAVVEAREPHTGLPPLGVVRTGAVSRLAWQAAREVWPIWWALAALGVGLPLLCGRTIQKADPAPWIFGALVVGLISGVNIFNAENRRGTQRFLAHHGARPTVVWLVKLAVGMAAVAPIWLTAVWVVAPSWRGSLWGPAPMAGGPIVSVDLVGAAALLGGNLVGALAAGAWCGMAFRRGITAGLIALILWVVVCLPPMLLVPFGLVWPTHLIWVPVAMLAVTWAWSGDWLLDRPGLGRWARLGLYSIAAAVGVFSAYVADRAWGVPAIPPAERERIFQAARIAAPIPAEENAAEIYREVHDNDLFPPPTDTWIWILHDLADEDWDASDPEVIGWLNSNKANLELLRKAAAMPACRFRDLRWATVFSVNNPEWGLSRFAPALVASSRVRFARGELKGAWDDIDALLRMGRQFSGLNPSQVRRWGKQAESWGLAMAMRWVADPRQTVESLEAARAAIRSLPPLPSLADQFRADALVMHTTIAMPREDLIRERMAREKREYMSMYSKLALDAMTTPWELARARRAYDLVAAARIQLAEREPDRFLRSPGPEDVSGGLALDMGPTKTVLSVMDLQMLAMTAPMMNFANIGLDWIVSLPSDENIAPRRALDVILGLRLWQVRHDGQLPCSLEELAAADPELGDSLIDPFANPPARFRYAPSRGQGLLPLGLFDSALFGSAMLLLDRLEPTTDHMLLYSVGPDGVDDWALTNIDPRGKGDVVYPIKDDVPPPG